VVVLGDVVTANTGIQELVLSQDPTPQNSAKDKVLLQVFIFLKNVVMHSLKPASIVKTVA
jgi:hypothetical protein